MTIPKMKNRVREMLTDKRYEHTLGVEYTACCLAYRYGADPEKARIAAILHDCAKYVPHHRMILECEEAGCPVSDSERKNPALLHAKLGAIYAEKLFGIQDPEILSAILWHTTGKPDMSLLEKIIYIADYMEPNRDKSPILPEVRAEAFRNLDLCLYRIMDGMMAYLAGGLDPVDPMTKNAYDYYKTMTMHIEGE